MATESATVATTRSDMDGWSGPLALADTLIGIGGPFAVSSPVLLARVLQDFADPTAIDPLTAAGLLDPAALFDGFTTRQLMRLRPLLDRAFTVMAYPRQHLPQPQPGDLLLRRALGEPGLGHVAFIAGQDAYPCEEASRRGLWLESMRPGFYVRVVEPGSHPHRLRHRFARRIATAEGALPADTLILRPRLRNRFHPVTAELSLEQVVGGGGGGGSAVFVVDPFPSANSIAFSGLNPSLKSCIGAASQVANVSSLCTGVIDLTGVAPPPFGSITLPYVGHNDSARLYVGSVAKIYPLLAAFVLRERVSLQAKSMILLHGLSTSTPGWKKTVFDTIQSAWQPKLDAKFLGRPPQHPDFSAILDLAPDGTASFLSQFTDWIKLATEQNDEQAAGKYIRALSYPYINGVLESAGFFDPATDTGLWISGDYNGNDWLPRDQAGKPVDPQWQKPGHAVSNFVGTAKQLARFVGLIASGNLAASASSSDIMDLLGVPWLDGILRNASPARSFTSAVGKVGIGTWDARDHDAAILTWERDPSDAARTIRYAVVILGSDRHNTQMAQLELAYHDCIVAQHP